jgi:hypothetical protein
MKRALIESVWRANPAHPPSIPPAVTSPVPSTRETLAGVSGTPMKVFMNSVAVGE